MQDFATQLFADYKLNPAVIAHCEKPLNKECKDQVKSEGGALDCLMSLADSLENKCYEAVRLIFHFFIFYIFMQGYKFSSIKNCFTFGPV